jgi:DNA-directed RNA polymerase specialized sigma24 family protein
MTSSHPQTPLWPSRLKAACRDLGDQPGGAGLRRAQAEVWQILNLALTIYLRGHAKRMGDVSLEVLEDIAAEKSLDLITRLGAGQSDFHDREPREIMSFFSKVARNELLGHLRQQGRFVTPRDDEDDEREWDMSGAIGKTAGSLDGDANLPVERKEFATALLECAQRMKPRSRQVWLFRVLYNMASKDIAAHPRVELESSHVDVLLQRSRGDISDCMGKKGFRSGDMPSGVFTVLWQAFRGAELNSGPSISA